MGLRLPLRAVADAKQRRLLEEACRPEPAVFREFSSLGSALEPGAEEAGRQHDPNAALWSPFSLLPRASRFSLSV